MASPIADLNLLFAVVALQNELVSRDDLLRAMNAWGLEKDRLLADLLVEAKALSLEDRQLLDGLVERQLKRHGSAEKSLAAAPVTPSLKEQLRSLCPGELTVSLAQVNVEGNETLPSAVSASGKDNGRRYRVLRPHARGGLGEVFVAQDTELDREIALKEIQRQFADHEASRGRFVLEAEITGGLEHPGIVPVYGLGAYEDGRPFYAMRFIRGDNLKEAIARFHQNPDQQSPDRKGGEHAPDFTSLEFRQLLGRFIDVCNAVAYAHSRGVLHRDLKPGNIMLGKFGETLVVDWGLAKVKGRGEQTARSVPEEATLRPHSASSVQETVAGAAIGTPAYMAPEQAAGRIDDLGPAADVYSLGATLYSLLTNRPPVQGADTGEILRKVQRGDVGFAASSEPEPRASSEPGAAATGKHPTTKIPKPLIAVCRKAMALDAADRYATPLDLAHEVEHWLADEPVGAYAEPLPARAKRWMRKRPGPVAALAAAVLVGLIGLLIGALLLGEKNKALSESNGALAASNEKLDAANADLKGTNARLDEANIDLKTTNEKLELARSVAEKAAAAERLAADKEREATAIATTRLTQIEKANQLIESIFNDIDPRAAEKGGPLLIEQLTKRLIVAADTLDEKAIGDPLAVARLQSFLGNTLVSLGESEKAITLHERAHSSLEKLFGPDHDYTLTSMNNLAECYRASGKLDLALPLLEETLNARRAKFGPDHPATLASMNNLAGGFHASGRLDLALPLWEESLKTMKATLGPDHPSTLTNMGNLAVGYRAAGKLDFAMPLLEETFNRRKATLGLDHPDTLISMSYLATGYQAARNLDQALPLFEQVLKRTNTKLGPDHPETLHCMNNLGTAYREAGKLDQALPLLEETLKRRKFKLGLDHPNTLVSMANLAIGYRAIGKLNLALPLWEETLKGMKAKLGPDHPDTLINMNNLAVAYRDAGKLDLALTLWEETLKRSIAILGPNHPDTLISMYNLAIGYRTVGKLDLALPLFEETLKVRKSKLGPDHPDTLACMHILARGYHVARKLELALPLWEELLALEKSKLGADHPNTLSSMNKLAEVYRSVGKLDLAFPLFEETLKRLKATLGPDHPHTLAIMGNMMKAHLEARQPATALPLVEEYVTGKRKQLGKDDPRFGNILASVGLDLLKTEQFPDAEKLMRECLAIREKSQPESWSTFHTRAMLGASLLGQKKYKEAEPLLLQGFEGMKSREKTIPEQGKRHVVEAAERLVQLYEVTDRKDEAKKWAAVLIQEDGKVDATIHVAAKELTLKSALDAEVPHRIYQTRLKAGATYQIDLISQDTKALDPYLIVQNIYRQTLAKDDNGGGMLNARLFFRAPTDGVYRLRVTSKNGGRGAFTLTVRKMP